MTLDELKEYCNGEFLNVDRIVGELTALYGQGRPDYTLVEQAAMAAFMMNCYSGIENVLKQMLLYDKLEIDDSPGWHEKILRKAGEIGILPPELLQGLSRYLSFRNFFIYSYVFAINWDDMKPLVEGMRETAEQVRSEVQEYFLTF
jgi:uncharacterized protein YutE (UPF0331/DUF86 family)